MRIKATHSNLVAALLATTGCDPFDDLKHAPESASETDGSSTTDASTSSMSGPESHSSTDTTEGPDPSSVSKLDVVFVVDNSGSMGQEQGNLAASLEAVLPGLAAQQDIDWRIAVTTTDLGNPWCSSSSEAGSAVLSSCRSRISDFVFEGVETVDAQAECTDHCALETLEILPSATHVDPTPAVRRWIEFGPSGTNVAGELTETVQCMLPMGINGCGFESPLEAVRKFLLRSETPEYANYGFVRPDAHLAVVIVSDEVDCSAQINEISIPGAEIFMQGSPFWTDPQADSPTSAVCWNAGTSCEGPPSDMSCVAQDYDVDRQPTTDPDAAVLYPLSRYREHLQEVAAVKKPFGARIGVYGILGVPPDFPTTGEVTYAEGEGQFQSDFGIGPGCESSTSRAVPPVRMLELIGNFGPAQDRIHSICDASFVPALTRILEHALR